MFDVHPDGERLALAPAPRTPGRSNPDSVVFVFNFFDELRRISERYFAIAGAGTDLTASADGAGADYFSFACSACACARTGTSGSASFHNNRNS